MKRVFDTFCDTDASAAVLAGRVDCYAESCAEGCRALLAEARKDEGMSEHIECLFEAAVALIEGLADGVSILHGALDDRELLAGRSPLEWAQERDKARGKVGVPFVNIKWAASETTLSKGGASGERKGGKGSASADA